MGVWVCIESNCPGVYNREELRLDPLKSRKDSPSLNLCSMVLCYFQHIYFYVVHLFFVSLPCVYVTLTIEVKVLKGF